MAKHLGFSRWVANDRIEFCTRLFPEENPAILFNRIHDKWNNVIGISFLNMDLTRMGIFVNGLKRCCRRVSMKTSGWLWGMVQIRIYIYNDGEPITSPSGHHPSNYGAAKWFVVSFYYRDGYKRWPRPTFSVTGLLCGRVLPSVLFTNLPVLARARARLLTSSSPYPCWILDFRSKEKKEAGIPHAVA